MQNIRRGIIGYLFGVFMCLFVLQLSDAAQKKEGINPPPAQKKEAPMAQKKENPPDAVAA